MTLTLLGKELKTLLESTEKFITVYIHKVKIKCALA